MAILSFILFFFFIIEEANCVTARSIGLSKGDICYLTPAEALFYNPATLGFFSIYSPQRTFSFSTKDTSAFSYTTSIRGVNFSFGYKKEEKKRDFIFASGHELLNIKKINLVGGLCLNYEDKKRLSLDTGLCLTFLKKRLRFAIYSQKLNKMRYGVGYKLERYNLKFFLAGDPFSLGIELMNMKETDGIRASYDFKDRGGNFSLGFILPLNLHFDYAFSQIDEGHYFTISIISE